MRGTKENSELSATLNYQHSIPETWTWASVRDVVETAKYGSSAKTSTDASGIPVLRMGNIQDGKLELSKLKYLPRNHDEFPALILSKGDLLFNRTNSSELVGKTAVYNGNPAHCSFASYLISLRLRPECDPKLLSHYINSLFGRKWVASVVSQQVGQANVNGSKLQALSFPLPPILEQKRIVAKIEELFSDLDAGIAALERVRTKLKSYRASVLKSAVEGKLTEEWREKHPDVETGSALLDRMLTERRRRWEERQLAKFTEAGKQPPKDWKSNYRQPAIPDTTDISSHPGSWCVASIDQLCPTLTSGSRDWSQFYDRGTGTFLMAQNVRMGRIDLSYRQAVDPPKDSPDRSRSQVEEGDILITIVGANTGEVCRIPKPLPEHYVCQSVALARPTLTELSPFIENYLISDENGQKQFRKYMYGAGRPHLSFDQIKMTAVLIPSIEEQKQIVSEIEQRLSIVDEIESQIEANLKRASRLRQSILKRAFEGKLVPQDLEDEPADRLLERIRQAKTQVTAKQTIHESRPKGQKPARRKQRAEDPSLFD